MKNLKHLILIAVLLLSSTIGFAQQSDCIAVDMPKEDVNQAEKESLLHMYEEEKLAGDVYKTLYSKWDLRIFSNISKAEDHHQSNVASLLDKYEIAYEKNLEIGSFHSSELQKLYDALIAQGNESLQQALVVGATVEDVDIFDLEKYLKEDVDSKDISLVYSNLLRGSENHMRAFTRWLNRYDINYQAQYISQEKLEKIISK